MSTRHRFSIIIAVRDRLDKLEACLRSVMADPFEGGVELVLACDGGPLEMEAVIRRIWTREFQWIHLIPSGPARARNAALDRARGEVFVFLNDDVTVEPGFLAAHDAAHRERPGHAVVGNTRWAPETMTTDFMHWVAHHDSFYYLIDDPLEATWEYFHTLNASVDRRWFDAGARFDESFPDPAFEDTELGYRLGREGMKIAFTADAILWHHHPFTADDYLGKSWMRGRSARRLVDRHPELHDRLVGEYLHAARRSRLRLGLRAVARRRDGPEQWHTRFALAFLAGFQGKPAPALARKCR